MGEGFGAEGRVIRRVGMIFSYGLSYQTTENRQSTETYVDFRIWYPDDAH